MTETTEPQIITTAIESQQPQTPQPIKKPNLQDINETVQYLAQFAQGLYPLIRAMDGLPPTDDPTYGLINRGDPRETGMLEKDGIDTHVAWDVASKKCGGEGNWLRAFDWVRASDLPYQKTKEGKNWVLTAALVGKGQPQQPGTNINIGTPSFNNPNWSTPTNPNDQQNPQQGPPKKKHFWSR